MQTSVGRREVVYIRQCRLGLSVLLVLLAALSVVEPVLVLLAVGHGGPFERAGFLLYLLVGEAFSTTQVGTAQVGPEQVGTSQEGLLIGAGQVDIAQVGIAQVGIAQYDRPRSAPRRLAPLR